MRQVTLNAVQAGMTRLRDKGGANPNSLFELTNAHVTPARSIEGRPGTLHHASLPPETRGLCVYLGQLTTFCHRPVAMPAGIGLQVLGHPTFPDVGLRDIHFAAPFMGFLYVVAEFSNGDLFHFWLESISAWTAGAVVIPGQTVSPAPSNGYIYAASRTDAAGQPWAAGQQRSVGDVVEPTRANGYRYRVVATAGPRPASGTVEPAWPAGAGLRVTESVDIAPPADRPPPVADGSGQVIRDDLHDRYPGLLR